MTTYSAKNITFTNTYTRIPDIKLVFKDASDNILTKPVDATNITTTGFTIPSFTSDLQITKCDWTAGGVKQKVSNTVIIKTKWLTNFNYASGIAEIPMIAAGTKVTVYIQSANTIDYVSFQNDNSQYIEPYTGPAVGTNQSLTVNVVLDHPYDHLVIHSTSNYAPTFSVTYSYFI